jgi:hypothetical protein
MQALDRAQPVLPMMPGMPQRQTPDYVRHGTTSLFAAFDIADGSVICQSSPRCTAGTGQSSSAGSSLRSTVNRQSRPHRPGCAPDLRQPGYPQDPAIRNWLARHPRFHLHLTPTGSSWINQVERWFGLLTDQLIRRGVHRSVVALENDVREWIKKWNEDPKPFVWTKTAEDILQSPSKYMAKISGAEH